MAGKEPWFTCPCCREVSQQVLVRPESSTRNDWASLDGYWEDFYCGDSEEGIPVTGIYFEDKVMYQIFLQLIRPTKCLICNEALESQEKVHWKSGKKGLFCQIDRLKYHMRRAHDVLWCEVCFAYQNGSRFPHEHVRYEGSKNLRSHCKKDHVWCSICNCHYFDVDSFNYHWRGADNHFSCRLCGLESRKAVLFSSFDSLWTHHEKSHFPCKFPDCKSAEQVFSNTHQLQLHLAKTHCVNTDQFRNVGRRGIIFNFGSEDSISGTRTKKKDSAEIPQSGLPIPSEILADMPEIYKLLTDATPAQTRAVKYFQDQGLIFLSKEAGLEELERECFKLTTGDTTPKDFLRFLCMQVYIYSKPHLKSHPEQNEQLSHSGGLIHMLLYTKPIHTLKLFEKELLEEVRLLAENADISSFPPEKSEDFPPTTSGEYRYVLSNCTYLPVSKSLGFTEAMDWALKQYILNFISTTPETPESDKLPIELNKRLKNVNRVRRPH